MSVPVPRLGIVGLLLLGGCGVASPEAATGPSSAVPSTAVAPVLDPVVDAVDTTESAAATEPAVRDVSTAPASPCDLTLVPALAARHPEAGQWIVVRTADWTSTTAVVDVVARRRDGSWTCQRASQPAMVGRSGVRPLADRRSGDGTAPAGVFPLGTATAWDGQVFQFFGNGADPGVRGTYRAVQTGDCWGATPGRSSYNHLVRDTSCTTGDDEYLPSITGAYVHAALIGANGEPEVSGDGPGETPFAAAIFLHRHAYTGSAPKPTSGCVSLALEDLVPTLDLIDPALTPRFAIGPADWLATTA